jgi:hypothetical protein
MQSRSKNVVRNRYYELDDDIENDEEVKFNLNEHKDVNNNKKNDNNYDDWDEQYHLIKLYRVI